MIFLKTQSYCVFVSLAAFCSNSLLCSCSSLGHHSVNISSQLLEFLASWLLDLLASSRISPPQQVPMDKDRALFLSVFWEEEAAGQAAVGMTP